MANGCTERESVQSKTIHPFGHESEFSKGKNATPKTATKLNSSFCYMDDAGQRIAGSHPLLCIRPMMSRCLPLVDAKKMFYQLFQ